jgi:prepilin-type N-terminal cleavage/methylation domain-containing protein
MIRRAFTLVELLVAIGVIAVLAALVVAVGAGALARSERSQVESAFEALDQAIVALEESRGQPLVFNRRRDVANPGSQDGMQFSDIDELPPGMVNEAYIMPRLLSILAANSTAWSSLSTISPDLLRREERRWNDGSVTEWNLRDPWSSQVTVYPPGRAATRGELRRARQLVKAGGATAGADPLGLGIDLHDATVRTLDEVSLAASCSGRRWLFVSAGPNRSGGRVDSATSADDIRSYEPTRPQP